MQVPNSSGVAKQREARLLPSEAAGRAAKVGARHRVLLRRLLRRRGPAAKAALERRRQAAMRLQRETLLREALRREALQRPARRRRRLLRLRLLQVPGPATCEYALSNTQPRLVG